MDTFVDKLLETLKEVRTTRDFKRWVRFELRQYFPHASFLATLGSLYGVGSIPTHRVDVDFPLCIAEELKNSVGALDDPLIHGWLRSGKLRYIDLDRREGFGEQQQWRDVLSGYGMNNLLIHGVLNHSLRRFVVFQLGNVYGGGSLESIRLVNGIVSSMADVVWATIDSRSIGFSRRLVGHPTLTLTPTELQIIELLAQGLSNKEIARLRGVSDSTVKTQVQRTGAKLGATRRAEIVAIAMPMLCPLPAQNLVDYGFYPRLGDSLP